MIIVNKKTMMTSGKYKTLKKPKHLNTHNTITNLVKQNMSTKLFEEGWCDTYLSNTGELLANINYQDNSSCTIIIDHCEESQ